MEDLATVSGFLSQGRIREFFFKFYGSNDGFKLAGRKLPIRPQQSRKLQLLSSYVFFMVQLISIFSFYLQRREQSRFSNINLTMPISIMLMFRLKLCDTLKKIMTSSGEGSFALTVKVDTISWVPGTTVGMIRLLDLCQKIKLVAAILMQA